MRISDWSSDVCSSDLYRAATPKQLQDAGRKWLSDGDYVLRILPFGDLAARGVDADRSAVPAPAGVVPATFPKVERAQLANGMTLVVARRSGVPLVNMTLLLKTGVPADYASLKRSEEHTSELQSLMRISYAVFCLNKKKEKSH